MNIYLVTSQQRKDTVERNVYWDNWGTTTSFKILVALTSKPEVYKDGLEVSCFTLSPERNAASLYALVMRYSELDSFGSNVGLGEVLWLYTTRRGAENARIEALTQINQHQNRRPNSILITLEMSDGNSKQVNIQNPASNGRDYIDEITVCNVPLLV
ncbi:hypothetical protein LMH73_026375 [Vibrio splendidus]|nr:hypothetical protein [Vibrio splendidus]MCC4880875.1 hypothetical protein [Vibrio splendidus]